MTTTADHLARVAARIGKKPEEVWPGWYAPVQIRVCKICGGNTKVIGLARICADLDCLSDRLTLRNNGEYSYRGPDLTQPEHLNDALEVADALCVEPCQIEYWPYDGNVFMCRMFIGSFPDARIQRQGFGPTRTAAVIAAIEEAVK